MPLDWNCAFLGWNDLNQISHLVSRPGKNLIQAQIVYNTKHMISFIEFSGNRFVFPQNHNKIKLIMPDWRQRERERETYLMALCTVAELDCTNTAIIYILSLFTTYSLVISPWRLAQISRGQSERVTRWHPKGPPYTLRTLDSLFLSAPAEVLRENNLVRLRLLAEFLLRLELFSCDGRSGTAPAIKYFTPNNGRHWNTIFQH